MSDVMTTLGNNQRKHLTDTINGPKASSGKSVNITVAAERELLEQVDTAIQLLNEKLPAMAQINRARFLRGCLMLGLADLEALMSQ
jgi:hypothetical protein